MKRREGVVASFSACLCSLNSRMAPMLLAVDEQTQSAVVRARALGDRKVEQTAGEGERDRHPEGTADQRPQPTEEERIRPTDVVIELERAAVDPLDDAHDRADGPRNERRDGS